MLSSLNELLNRLREVIALADRAPSSHESQLATRAIRRITRELAPFAAPPHMASQLEEPWIQQSADMVHIGCGSHHINGFLNIDLFPPADLVFDIRAGFPLSTGTASVVFSEHMLEHVDFDFSAPFIIGESFRVLREGGNLIIGVPDAERVVKAFANNDENYLNEIRKSWYSNRRTSDIYRDNFDIVSLVFHDEFSHEKYNPHYWGYSYGSIEKMIMNCGFASVERLDFPPSYANEERLFGTLYVRATK